MPQAPVGGRRMVVRGASYVVHRAIQEQAGGRGRCSGWSFAARRTWYVVRRTWRGARGRRQGPKAQNGGRRMVVHGASYVGRARGRSQPSRRGVDVRTGYFKRSATTAALPCSAFGVATHKNGVGPP